MFPQAKPIPAPSLRRWRTRGARDRRVAPPYWECLTPEQGQSMRHDPTPSATGEHPCAPPPRTTRPSPPRSAHIRTLLVTAGASVEFPRALERVGESGRGVAGEGRKARAARFAVALGEAARRPGAAGPYGPSRRLTARASTRLRGRVPTRPCAYGYGGATGHVRPARGAPYHRGPRPLPYRIRGLSGARPRTPGGRHGKHGRGR